MTDVALRERLQDGAEAELVDGFQERALAIAASAAAPNTRRAYATAYRAFAAFLHAQHGEASIETFTVTAVAGWRDELAAQGLSASTVAQRVSAVRRLAAAIGADPLVAQVRCTHVQHERPAALSDRELSALLARPDLRTTIGTRDRAILELLARAGLRRSELARLTLADVQERGRQSDARRRTAIAPRRGEQTLLEVVVRASKEGRSTTLGFDDVVPFAVECVGGEVDGCQFRVLNLDRAGIDVFVELGVDLESCGLGGRADE